MASDKPSFPSKLTKGRTLYGSPSWVTNGILAVRRDRIANEALFAPRVAELALGAEGFKDKDDAYFERLIPLGLRVRVLNRTEMGFLSLGAKGNGFIFRDGMRLTDMVLVAEEVVRTFGLESLYRASPDGVLVAGEVDLEGVLIHADMVIAPMKVEAEVWQSLTEVASRIDNLKEDLGREMVRMGLRNVEEEARELARERVAEAAEAAIAQEDGQKAAQAKKRRAQARRKEGAA